MCILKNNTSIIQDEVLASRLGLTPISVDPRLFEYLSENDQPNEKNTIVFTLHAKCARGEPRLKVKMDEMKWLPNGRFTSLAGALPENNTIRTLHLNGNYGGALAANALAKGLEDKKSLQELHLHENSIGDEGARVLMSGLSSHRGKLTLLDLGNNSISSKGATYIAEYINGIKSLLWFNLYMNDIGDEGAVKVADALKQNCIIATIDMGGNNIHTNGVNAIAQSLKDNTIITTSLVITPLDQMEPKHYPMFSSSMEM